MMGDDGFQAEKPCEPGEEARPNPMQVHQVRAKTEAGIDHRQEAVHDRVDAPDVGRPDGLYVDPFVIELPATGVTVADQQSDARIARLLDDAWIKLLAVRFDP